MHATLRPVAFTLALAATVTLPLLARAQAPAVADDATVPPATCVKPALPDATKPLEKADSDKLNAQTKAYQVCADTYLKARRATAAKHQAIANANADAANALAAEFNGYASALDAYNNARKAADAAATGGPKAKK
jgi:hypothetical protein